MEGVTRCSQCYYFQRIHKVNTCQLKGGFIGEDVVGCYSGSRNRDEGKEELYRMANRVDEELSRFIAKQEPMDIKCSCTHPFDMVELLEKQLEANLREALTEPEPKPSNIGRR